MFKPSRSVETSSPDLMLLQSVDYAWSPSASGRRSLNELVVGACYGIDARLSSVRPAADVVIFPVLQLFDSSQETNTQMLALVAVQSERRSTIAALAVSQYSTLEKFCRTAGWY